MEGREQESMPHPHGDFLVGAVMTVPLAIQASGLPFLFCMSDDVIPVLDSFAH
jgi:hypothetical protein